MASSMSSPSELRSSAIVARRGSGGFFDPKWASTPSTPGPDARTTAIPARPEPEARAMMVSVLLRGFIVWPGHTARRDACAGLKGIYNSRARHARDRPEALIPQAQKEPRMSRYVTIKGKDGDFKAYVADGTKHGPAILIIQEIFGVNHFVREVADRYAAEGYTAIAP